MTDSLTECQDQETEQWYKKNITLLDPFLKPPVTKATG